MAVQIDLDELKPFPLPSLNKNSLSKEERPTAPGKLTKLELEPSNFFMEESDAHQK